MMKKILFFAIPISLIVIALLAYLLLSGTFTRIALEKAIVQQAHETGEVNISEVTSFDWDLMYIFGPYISEETINETLGFDAWNYNSALHDGLQLLLFVKNQEVVQYLKMERSPDFVNNKSIQVFTPKNAIFIFDETESNTTNLPSQINKHVIEDCDLFNLPNKSIINIEINFFESPNPALRELLFNNGLSCEGEDPVASSCKNWVISGSELSSEVIENIQLYESEIQGVMCRYTK